MQAQVREVKGKNRQYRDATVEAKAATQSVQEAREQMQKLYSQHVLLGRVALQNNPVMLEKMDLKGIRKKSYSEWLEQAGNFYHYAGEVKEDLAKYNISEKEINESQKLLGKLKEMQQLQYQLKAQAQVLSEHKKQAYIALYRKFSKFIQLARLALDEEPQHLEALGLVVKA